MEFENLKQRCEYPICNQIEYLPIQCKYCSKWHCASHQRTDNHECKAKQFDSKMITECPMCLQKIEYLKDADVNLVVATHMSSGQCKPENYQKVVKKRKGTRCKAAKCFKKLNSLNKIQCKRCRQFFCLSHRFADSHDCNPESFFAGRGRTIASYA